MLTYCLHPGRLSLKLFSAWILLLFICTGCGSINDPYNRLSLDPESTQVRGGGTIQFTATTGAGATTGGTWSVPQAAGSISASGMYTAPTSGMTGTVTVTYNFKGHTATAQIEVENPQPVINAVSPSTLSQVVTPVVVSGSGFIPTSSVAIDGVPAKTTYIDNQHLSLAVPLPPSDRNSVGLSVVDSDPTIPASATLSVPVVISGLRIAAPSMIRAGDTSVLNAYVGNVAVQGGTWSLAGSASFGTITTNGTYVAPASAPTSAVIVTYSMNGTSATATFAVDNGIPQIASANPTIISSLEQPLQVTGRHFAADAVLLVDGTPVPTSVTDDGDLRATVQLPNPTQTSVTLAVSNPNPGAAVSNTINVQVNLAAFQLSPSQLPPGDFRLVASLKGLPQGSQLMLDGSVLPTVANGTDSITVAGWLAPWRTGTVHISLLAPDGIQVLAETDEAIAQTAETFDAAARFAKQAGFGPRPDVVMHIQQIGFQAFLNEQYAAPVNDFHPSVLGPIRAMYLAGTTGSSLLRLRTAWGLQTFLPGLTLNEISPVVVPWEQTLERDAFTNYRTILRDSLSDPNIATRLSLPGNSVSSDPSVHPNQNFGRELMQLFSLGMYKLNKDGSTQLDTGGNLQPSYTQDDVVTMSRILTGWTYAPAVNPLFTTSGIDFSQTLVPNESAHDAGPKTLFGTVQIPAGQTTAQDRESALDALMNHPNTAPFVSKLLIQRFVTSQPSPSYVARISAVFRDNGQGVQGDMKSLITAILLDPEARSGDAQPSATTGILQDPITAQMFLLSALQISSEDDQPVYVPKELGEGVFDPPTIFGYFSPSFIIPGTTLNSPEYELYNNFAAVQRMQSLYGVTTLTAPGYNNGYSGWLYDHFTTPASMLEAADHLLLSGQMPPAEQTYILNYAATVSDPHQQLESIVFLALSSDNYTVVQ